MRKLVIVAFFFLLLFVSVDIVQGLRPGYVYDRAGKLTSDEVSSIASFCRQVERQSTVEIVVVILPNLDDYGGDISVARETIFNDESLDGIVGIGKVEADNGVLIVISVVERKWGIEIGYGLEGVLTDSESGRIGRDIMVPFLQNQDYYNALYYGATAVADEINGGSAFPDVAPQPEFDTDFWIMVGIVIFVVILSLVLRRLGYSSGSGRSYGGYGGWGGGGGSGGGGSGGGGSGGGGSSGGW